MSLINDALKRAKQAQQDAPAPTPSAAHLRPVEPALPAVRHGVGVLLPVSIAVVALLALLLLWQLSRRSSSAAAQPKTALDVAARTLSPSDTPPATVAPRAVNTSAPSKSVAGNAPETTAIGPEHLSNPTSPTASVGSNSISPALDSADTNHAATPEVVTPAPAPLKLQGIVFNPKRPSAMINGRIVFVGDRIRDLHVIAIHPDDVLLAGAGRTNLLSLDP